MLQKLAALNPDTIQWLCDRYDSAEQFQHMIMHASCGALPEDEITDWVEMIGELCTEDGADWGEIPCLGAGEHLSVWNALKEEYSADDAPTTNPQEFFGEGFSLIRR